MKRTLLLFTSLILFSLWIAVHAEDMADRKVDPGLKTLWNEMITHLKDKDIEGALGYFTDSTRERYREQFSLIVDRLPAIFSGMRDIEPVYIKGDEAKYRVKIKDEAGENTGYIWFRKDILGRWKIEKF